MTRGDRQRSRRWAILAVVLAGSGSAAIRAEDGCTRPARSVAALVAGINDQRDARGLPPLAWDAALCRVAERRAEEMARRGTVWQAEENRQSRRIAAEGYVARRWSERVSQGSAGPRTLLERWSGSTLGDYEHLAIVERDSRRGRILVLLLALSRHSADLRRAAPFSDLATIRAAVLDEVNAARRRAGRHGLRVDARLERAAQRHARDMVERGFYGHETPEGMGPRDRAEASGYAGARVIGENLARGLVTPEEIVELWLGSPGHRRNILDSRHSETGVGVAVSARAGGGIEVYWVQLFGTPRVSR